MKKFVALLMAMMMLTGLLPAGAEAGLQVGDVVHGFEVREITAFPLINADLTWFVHQKTGAELLYLANDDTNRVFELTFRTPAESDMGVPHVFEHATLGGSEKYPSKDLFFNLSYQTYNTYMNAATYSQMTTYPVASLSEDQLYLYADYYTDSCFRPMIHQDESIFTEEAWRYAMNNAAASLTIAGTVYSEMQGSYTLDSAAYQHYMDVMYPGSYASYAYGGVPGEIPNMTWQDVKDYHTRYYHPSNSLACLYGSFENYERFLELLDGYYSAYDRRDAAIADSGYAPISTAQTAFFAYPAEKSSDPANAARVYYGFRMDGLDADSRNALDLMCILLNSPALPLLSRLQEALPSGSFDCYQVIDAPVPSILFTATGIDEGDAETFRQTVDAALKEICETGFDREAVDPIVAAFNMDVRLITESPSLGVEMIPNFAYYWAATGDWHDYLKYIAALDEFAALAGDGTFVSLLDEHLVNNPVTALVTTVPQPGLKEEQDAALTARLAQVKADMTKEEIAAIVANTAALAQQTESTGSEYVAQLQAVTVDSLPEEVRTYEYTDVTGEDGVRRIDMAANADGVGHAMVMLDVRDLPQESLHYLQLYTELLGEVDTSAHDRAQLASLSTRYLYDGVIKVSMPRMGKTDLYLRASWIAADQDMAAAYDFIRELLLDTQFTDAKRVQELISAKKNALKDLLSADIYNSLIKRAQAIDSPTARVYNYTTDLDYYTFLAETEEAIARDPDAVLGQLQKVQQYVNNRSGAISAFAGSPESAAVHRAAADDFLASLDCREVVPALYDIPAPARAEGFIVDSAVQYNLTYATWEELGLADYTGDLDALTALVTDMFLIPLLRDRYGVYTVIHGPADNGLYLLTYRDPNVKETYDAFARIPALLGSYTADQETVDGYILSAYAFYAQPAGELAGAVNAIFNVIDGVPQDKALGKMQALKALKAEDVAGYVDMYRKLAEKGVRYTAGGMGAIEENADLFDAVLNPFGAIDPRSVVFEDCLEGHPQYEAVRYCYEKKLLAPAAETAFGVDDPAPMADLAAALYSLMGGGTDPAEALEVLAQYRILPANAPLDQSVTRAELAGCLASFAQANRLPIKFAKLPNFTDKADIPGKLSSKVAWALSSGLMAPVSKTEFGAARPVTRGDLAYALKALAGMLGMD